MNAKKALWILAAAIALVALVGCGGAGKTIKVGAIFNTTGGQASLDAPSMNGFKMAADEINAAGGIDGKKFKVVAIDGKTDQNAVANAVTKMIDVEKVVVVGGLSDSNYALAAGKIAQEKGIPFVTSGATLPTLPDQVGDFAFLAPFGDNVQAFACADFAIADLAVTKAYMLKDTSMEFTETLAKFFIERFVAKGGAITLADTYKNKDPDYSAQIERFLADQAKNPAQIIFISGVPDDAGTIVKQFRDKGVMLPIISGDGFDTPLLIEVAGAQAENVYVATHASLQNPSEKVQNFVANYTKKYKKGPENAFAALGYDTMYLIADAVKRAGSADPKAIRDALASTAGLQGVTGQVTYANGSHVPTKSVTINVVKGGTFAFVKEVLPE
jgi:branched-chain amino acid transport system substrate-binding protein